jgi:ABC-type polysaccharide/polyol phosphate export permease
MASASELAAATGTRSTRSVESTPWVHVTPSGTVFGGETPAGTMRGPLQSLRLAVVTTYSVRSTVWILVLKEFKSRYRAQALGLFWSLAYPLVMMATISVAFVYVLGVNIANFPIFYLIAAIFWHWFSNALLSATSIFTENGALVKRTTFPRYLLPVSRVLASFLSFLTEWVLVIAFYFDIPDAFTFTYRVVALPLLCLITFTLLVGASLVLSVLDVRYRDVYYMVTSVLTVGFWLSPILYPVEKAPEHLRWLFYLNPMTGVMEGARAVLMHGRWPSLVQLGSSGATACLVFLIGCVVFRRYNLTLADHL